jgi:hypothetical protein
MAVARGDDSRDCASAPCRTSAELASKLHLLRRRVARVLTIAVVMSCIVPVLGTVVASVTAAVPLAAAATGGSTSVSGYWLVASDGGVFNYGTAAFYGSTGAINLNKPIVAMAANPGGQGYWLVASDGGVFPYGDAAFYGSTGGLRLENPIVAMAASPDGRGYWLVASDGGVFSFGDAAFYGSTGGMSLKKAIVAMATTPDGRGYWLVASDGGIFAYGDATFYGSTGWRALNKPIVTMTATPDGRGYWLVASDGGVFTYGDAAFYGSTGGMELNKPIVTMAASPDGRGYWLVASDGGVFTYGDAAFYGSTGGMGLNKPIVAMAAPSLTTAAVPQTIGAPTGATTALAGASPSTTTTTPEVPAATTTSSSTTTTTTSTTTTTVPSVGLSAPAGYTTQQKIFDDQFSGNRLDTSKWVTYLGAEGGRWNNMGNLPSPYSGPNLPITNEAAMFGPSQVNVDNGLTLTATRNTNQFASSYPWLSGVVTTEGKFTLPTSAWYVQVKAKMPDQSHGMWPAIWFLCGVSCSSNNELDGYEGGWVSTNPNQLGHSDYFADQGQRQDVWSSGADVTAGFHVYGYQFIPGQSITGYFDGKLVWQVTASSGVTIPGEPYEIMLELQVAAQQASGWHTVTTGSTPSATMDVAEVQAYS